MRCPNQSNALKTHYSDCCDAKLRSPKEYIQSRECVLNNHSPLLAELFNFTSPPHYTISPRNCKPRRKNFREKIHPQMKHPKSVDNPRVSDIIKSNNVETAVNDVNFVGKIDREIYRCVTEDIATDDVVITDERIAHIKERHPNDYERYCSYIPNIIAEPDYIIKANKPNTGVLLKEILLENRRGYMEKDNKEQKNTLQT